MPDPKPTPEAEATTAVVQASPPTNGPPKLNVELSKQLGIVPKSIDELWRVAAVVHQSGLAPKGFDKEQKVFVALAYALEMGMPLMSALQCLAVINGKVAMYGDAMLARVRGKPEFKSFAEWWEDDKGRIDLMQPGAIKRRNAAFADGTLIARARLDRHDTPEPAFGEFSVDDAKRAKLFGKQGPWQEYPLRMLVFRARSFCLRDGAADLLNNMGSAEEAQDIPREPEFVVRHGATMESLGDRLAARAAQAVPAGPPAPEPAQPAAEASAEPVSEPTQADLPLSESEMAAEDAKHGGAR